MGFYTILGIKPGATQEEIKNAFRKKAVEFHPDRCFEKDAPEKFRKIKEAYDILSKTKTTTPQPKPQPKKPSINDLIVDAPPPTHDIWGVPYKKEKFIDSVKYEQNEVKIIRRKKEELPPEVDLWKSTESQQTLFHKKYWQEYDRLKKDLAYEDPEKFWNTLDLWVKNYKH